MKIALTLAALIFSATAFADDTEVNGQIESLSPDMAEKGNGPELVELGQPTTRVIDNAEESAEDVKDGVRESGEGSTGQARRRADVKMEDVSVDRVTNNGQEVSTGRDETHTSVPKSKAQDYNSSRSNRRGDEKYGKAEGLPTGKRQHRDLDTDDDGDSIPVKDEACNAVDNDCDDTTDTIRTESLNNKN